MAEQEKGRACSCGHSPAEHYANGCGWCLCKISGPATDDESGRTRSGAVLTPEIIDRALDAAVRHHFEAMHEAGICVPFERIGETSRRIVRYQVRGTLTAALAAAFGGWDDVSVPAREPTPDATP